MFGIAPSELLLLAVVALVVIGPKDLPRVLRTVGIWSGQVRGLSRQLKSGIDQVIRESELIDFEQRFKIGDAPVSVDHVAPATVAPGAMTPPDEPDRSERITDPAI